jgi:hypothetical protein
MDHRISFEVEIIRNDMGETEDDKGNDRWLAGVSECKKRFLETILSGFFV